MTYSTFPQSYSLHVWMSAAVTISSFLLLAIFGQTVHADVHLPSSKVASHQVNNSILQWFHPAETNRRSGWQPSPNFCAPQGSDSNGDQQERARRRKKRKRQIKRLSQKYMPNGKVTIMKRGAIKGGRTMDNPWTVETNHYTVKTNISRKAAGEIALIMEMFYNAFVQSSLFKVEQESYEKRPVVVPKNRTGFLDVLSSHGVKRVDTHIKGYYLGESEDKTLVTYYFHTDDLRTHNMLLALGTRQFIDMVMKSNVPDWLEEGLVMYFERSRFRGWKVQGGVIDRERIREIREDIRMEHTWREDYVEEMSVLMRQSENEFVSGDHAHAWSLVHFLIHWKNGRLAGKLRKYLSAYKEKNMNKDPVQHFRQTFGFDPEKLRRPWESYVFRK